MTRLRDGLEELLAALPGGKAIESPKDLEARLGINYKLAWQIHRVATALNPLDEATNMPRPAAFRKFLQRAQQRRGVSEQCLNRVRDAAARFDELIQAHAGDRATFDAMVTGLASPDRERIDLSQRKAAFRANSHIWGVQIKARMACIIIQPNDDEPELIDLVMVRGVVGLKQLRPGRSFVISSVLHMDSNNVVDTQMEAEQLGIGDSTSGINLLREFSSKPLPEIRNHRTAQGRLITEIVNRDVGTSAAFTGFLCDLFRKTDVRYQDENNHSLVLGSNIRYPVEVNATDAVIRRDTYGKRLLRFRTECRGLTGERDIPEHDHDLLFAGDDVEYLGCGAEQLQSPDFPRYTDMIRHVMERLDWDSDEFDAYRHRLMYPVMPSSVVLTADLPEKPE